METFKYLYHGSNIKLLTSGYVVTEFILDAQYILIIQNGQGEVIETAQTDLREYE